MFYFAMIDYEPWIEQTSCRHTDVLTQNLTHTNTNNPLILIGDIVSHVSPFKAAFLFGRFFS